MKRTPLQRKTPLRAKATPARRARPKMTTDRKSACGKPCMVRLPGCDGGGETTVLAHYRIGGYCGVGMKPPDVLGAWACAKCHAAVDGVRSIDGYTRTEIRLAHAEACLRTRAEIETARYA